MEELLNKLIERGWKPFGKIPVDINQWCSWETYCKYFGKRCIHIHREDDIEYDEDDEDIRKPRRTDDFSLRELVSKESWLWQFVCKNGMVKKEQNVFENYWKDKYEYWLCKCALKDESELEDFLLNSIKLD